MKLLKTLDDIFAVSDAKRVLIEKTMDTKTFWRLYFWWGIRQARKRRIANEQRIAALPVLTNDEFWENQKKSEKN